MDAHPVAVSLAIKAEPKEIWAALTDGAVSPAYYAIYAAYGTGWDDPDGADPKRRGLTVEAERLCRLVVELEPDDLADLFAERFRKSFRATCHYNSVAAIFSMMNASISSPILMSLKLTRLIPHSKP